MSVIVVFKKVGFHKTKCTRISIYTSLGDSLFLHVYSNRVFVVFKWFKEATYVQSAIESISTLVNIMIMIFKRDNIAYILRKKI